jgi:hypothetical protein
MNVSSVVGTSPMTSIDPSQLAQGADQPSSTVLADDPPQVSERGKLMQELSDLQSSDPGKFKKVSEEISEKLKEAASSASGHQAAFLNKLADKFGQAAQSGDMSALQPTGGAGGHHGHHHVHKYAAQQQATDASGGQQQSGVDVAQIIQSTLDGVSA